MSDNGDDDSEPEETQTRGRSKKPKKRVSYGPSAISELFANMPTRKHTVRIDTKLLAEAESEDPRKGKAASDCAWQIERDERGKAPTRRLAVVARWAKVD